MTWFIFKDYEDEFIDWLLFVVFAIVPFTSVIVLIRLLLDLAACSCKNSMPMLLLASYLEYIAIV